MLYIGGKTTKRNNVIMIYISKTTNNHALYRITKININPLGMYGGE